MDTQCAQGVQQRPCQLRELAPACPVGCHVIINNALCRIHALGTKHDACRAHTIEAATGGVTVTLIDFTLSRLTALTGDVAFCNLAADPEIFMGPKGDVQVSTPAFPVTVHICRPAKLVTGCYASPLLAVPGRTSQKLAQLVNMDNTCI